MKRLEFVKLLGLISLSSCTDKYEEEMDKKLLYNFYMSDTIIDKLIASGKLVAYYDAKPQNVTVDSSRKISQLNDLTGNGHHLVQSTAARRPTYDLVNRITFTSGSQQYLINTTVIPSLQSSSIGIYGVFQSTSSDVFVVNFCDQDGTAFAGLRNSTTLLWGGTLNNGNTGIATNRDLYDQLYGLQVNRNVDIDVVENTTITTVADTSSSVLSDYSTVDALVMGARILATPAYLTYHFNSLYLTNGKLTATQLNQLVNYINNQNRQRNKILIAELGQSNMEGRDGDTANSAYPFTSGKGFEWTGTAEVLISTLRGVGVSRGSHANYFCEELYDISGRTPVLIECATGGTGLTSTSTTPNWSGSSTLRSAAETKINSALTFYSRSVPDFALWAQGESDALTMDANPSYTKAIVKAALQDVIDWWQTTYPDVPFIISELGVYNNGSPETQGWTDMRAIQNEIVSENNNVFIGFTGAKNFITESKMYDQLHYNYVGYQEMGEALANYINDNFF